ncbi:MAG: rRNA maturation RNase YbeY [Planctomycetes bacterium]|jgi:probable rRNA maturation factor|nr:rRNA maturation RNase YbeY [Planctomycetota bacterium]
MAVVITWDTEARPLTDEQVTRAIEAALEHGGRADAMIEVALVDDETLAELHGRYLNDPSVTDVMAFELGEEGGGPLGEIYVSVDRAEIVAGRRGSSWERELTLYLVHGALHLCGFNDLEDADREAMREAEGAVLERLGLPPDGIEHGLGRD